MYPEAHANNRAMLRLGKPAMANSRRHRSLENAVLQDPTRHYGASHQGAEIRLSGAHGSE
eukprot:9380120-Lingulodinium_polyedra.AAC.1